MLGSKEGRKETNKQKQKNTNKPFVITTSETDEKGGKEQAERCSTNALRSAFAFAVEEMREEVSRLASATPPLFGEGGEGGER
mmetsp:Transcript_26075/g.51163  ORF Transcript_26075/g.51163 Transcript_26075/m.51163 type:complete len:83 (-) Transcript_26075:676-924(-)